MTPVYPGGWDNRTFRLGDELLVRLPSAERYAPQVVKEQRWLPWLAGRLPLPIPIPVAKGEPGGGYPWGWSVYRWLPGEAGSTETIADMTEFARDLAAFLRALQGVDATGGPPAGSANFHRGGDVSVYDGETRAALRTLETAPPDGAPIDFAAAHAVWERALASRWERDPVWVHGDVSLTNVLVSDGRLSAVIDFGSCAVGDPACDGAIAWTAFAGESREVFQQCLVLDPETWDRARGWALWKALITLVERPDSAAARKTIREAGRR